MRILDIRPEPPGSGTKTLARFDVEVSDAVRLYGLRLIELPDGRRLSYAQRVQGFQVATFSPAFAGEITRAASAALREVTAHEQCAA